MEHQIFDLSQFPSPHIPNKLPMEAIIKEIISDSDFLRLCFQSSARLSEFIGYLQNLPNPAILVSSLTLQESVLSSKIEGTIATISDVVQGEPSSETIKNDIVEIENYVSAMNFGREELKDRSWMFSKFLICSLHQILLTNNVRGANKTPGQFKTEQNFIKNDIIGNFTPLPPYLTDEYIDNLVDYINTYNEVSPLIQAATVHAQFEMIHPFKDGNGRIGRLLIPLFLYCKNAIPFPTFYISRYFAANDNEYKKCLSDISKAANDVELVNAWKCWMTFFLQGVQQESAKHIDLSKKILKLSDELHTAIKRTDQYPIINYLFDYLRLEPKEFLKSSKLSSSTVYATLRDLTAAGYLERTGSERKTKYIFKRLVDILD